MDACSNAMSAALAGLEQSQSSFDGAVRQMVDATNPEQASGDVVELSAAAVGMIAAKNAFEANLKLVDTVSQMQAQVLNLLG